MEKMDCYRCSSEFNPDKDRFCSQCGLQFYTDKAKKKLLQEIDDIENEPSPYETMRFTASVIIGFGWVVIIIGWASTLFVYGGLIQILQDFVAIKNGQLFDIASVFFIVLVWAYVTIIGVMIIASGQFFLIMLDIRNDTHITMRLIRRFGLLMSEEK